jgi:glycerol transport system permease protein
MTDALAPSATTPAVAPVARRRVRSERSVGSAVVMTLYLTFLLLPIYWLVTMSLKTNSELLGDDDSGRGPDPGTLPADLHRRVVVHGLPEQPQLRGAEHRHLARGGAAGGLCLQPLPLPRRQAPVLLAAVEPHGAAGGLRAALLPALLRRRAVRHAAGVALAHCLFNVPLAVWILEGFMSGVPREIDETAALDGWSFPPSSCASSCR